jgi:hypothetical protein
VWKRSALCSFKHIVWQEVAERPPLGPCSDSHPIAGLYTAAPMLSWRRPHTPVSRREHTENFPHATGTPLWQHIKHLLLRNIKIRSTFNKNPANRFVQQTCNNFTEIFYIIPDNSSDPMPSNSFVNKRHCNSFKNTLRPRQWEQAVMETTHASAV